MTQAPSTTDTAHQGMWSASYREALGKRAQWWMNLGAIVLPVIPMQLPAERWHKTNRKTGEPVVDKDGNLAPTFPGKAPSAWNRKTGEPYLIQRDAIAKGTRKPPTQAEVIEDLTSPVGVGAAAEFGYPIGFCILTDTDLVVIDLDATDRNGDLLQRASGDQHYIEQTPSGGLHLVVSPADDMESWSKTRADGKTSFFTKWALEPGGEDCGEVLSVGKICLMAPTMRGDGKVYAPLLSLERSTREQEFSGDWDPSVLEVPSITEAFDIHPTASRANRKEPEPTKAPTTDRQSTANTQPQQLPALKDLIGQKAQGLLQGDLSAYESADDRSRTLASFAREVWGTENWLRRSALQFDGTADELLLLAVDALSTLDGNHEEPIEDKADRILDSIDPSTCDIRDEHKRMQRYVFLLKGVGSDPFAAKPFNRCDAKAAAEAGVQERPPFVLRGYDADHLIFAVDETGLEHSLRTNALNQSNLITIADYDWWADSYGYWNKKGDLLINWKDAANDLLRLRRNSSVYDPSNIRGIGVWSDGGRTVVHTGRELIVDGKKVSFAHFDSDFLYVKSPAVPGPHADEPTEAELQLLEQLANRWNYEDKIGPYLVLGWCITASLSGALAWRPNIWITGPTEAGKSSLIDNMIKALIAPIGGKTCSSETSAAGIHQTLRHDALPVVVDEFESDDEKARRRVDEIITMVRSSSSNEGGEVFKGTTSGSALSYLVRSSFAFASINVGLDKAQDRNRTSVVRLLPLTAHQRSEVVETMKLWKQVTTDMGQKLLARALRLLPVIEHNAELLEIAIMRGGHRQSHRIAKVEALLLAASYILQSEDRLTEETAADVVNAFMTKEAEVDDETREETNDAKQCLRHLLMFQIDATREVSVGSFDRRERAKITVLDACQNYMKPGAYDLREVDTELKRHGLMIKEHGGEACLLVGPPHNGFAAIYKGTEWRTPAETLKRDGAGGKPTGVQSFGGRQFRMRALAFPLNTLVGNDDDIPDMPKSHVNSQEKKAAAEKRAAVQAALTTKTHQDIKDAMARGEAERKANREIEAFIDAVDNKTDAA